MGGMYEGASEAVHTTTQRGLGPQPAAMDSTNCFDSAATAIRTRDVYIDSTLRISLEPTPPRWPHLSSSSVRHTHRTLTWTYQLRSQVHLPPNGPSTLRSANTAPSP